MKKSITSSVLRKMRRVNTKDEKLAVMKNAYAGETAFILSCGPSIEVLQKELDIQEFFRDRLVIACKQASELIPCDFQLFNPVRNTGFTRLDEATITIGSASAGKEDRLKMLSLCPDLWYEIDAGTPQLISSRKWDSAVFKGGMVAHPWGPGIVLDMGMWVALHLGVSRIVTIGWDMSNNYRHFYETDVSIAQWEKDKIKVETDAMRKAVPHLWDWLAKRNVDLVQFGPCSELEIPSVMSVDLWSL